MTKKQRTARNLLPNIKPGISQSRQTSTTEQVVSPWNLSPILVKTSDIKFERRGAAPTSQPAPRHEAPDAFPHSAGFNCHAILQDMPVQNK